MKLTKFKIKFSCLLKLKQGTVPLVSKSILSYMHAINCKAHTSYNVPYLDHVKAIIQACCIN